METEKKYLLTNVHMAKSVEFSMLKLLPNEAVTEDVCHCLKILWRIVAIGNVDEPKIVLLYDKDQLQIAKNIEYTAAIRVRSL